MGHIDLRGIAYLAMLGLVCAVIAGGWLLYHVGRALLLYVGAL